jgi:hypothetical protein
MLRSASRRLSSVKGLPSRGSRRSGMRRSGDPVIARTRSSGRNTESTSASSRPPMPGIARSVMIRSSRPECPSISRSAASASAASSTTCPSCWSTRRITRRTDASLSTTRMVPAGGRPAGWRRLGGAGSPMGSREAEGRDVGNANIRHLRFGRKHIAAPGAAKTQQGAPGGCPKVRRLEALPLMGTGFRLPLPKSGRLAQLVRARASHARGRGFKSLIAHASVRVAGLPQNHWPPRACSVRLSEEHSELSRYIPRSRVAESCQRPRTFTTSHLGKVTW